MNRTVAHLQRSLGHLHNHYASGIEPIYFSLYADWGPIRDLKSGFRTVVDLKFDPDVPESILAHKPLYMLYQMIDSTHVRVAFSARPEDPWFFSNVTDLSNIAKDGIGQIQNFDFAAVTGKDWGVLPGSPMYQKYLIDYIHYRYGLSK